MTTDDRDRVIARFDSFDAFEPTTDGYSITTLSVDGTVTISTDDEGPVYRVTVIVPTIDTVVEDETVASVVQEGWFETFERRLTEPHQVGVGLDPIEPIVVEDDGHVIVRMRFRDTDPGRAASNAKALAEFVEGTWVEGLIPGYSYREPASSVLTDAVQDYGNGEDTN